MPTPRPGLPLPCQRRSLSLPPQPGGWCAVPADEDYRLDPRYAEWYYTQRVRPVRLHPPVATLATCDAVDAARHRRLPGSGFPLPRRGRSPRLGSDAASSDGGWAHGRTAGSPGAGGRQLLLTPVSATQPAPGHVPWPRGGYARPVTPQHSTDGTPGHSVTNGSAPGCPSLQASPSDAHVSHGGRQPVRREIRIEHPAEAAARLAAVGYALRECPDCPPLWSETKPKTLDLLHITDKLFRVTMTGVLRLPNHPVQGWQREQSSKWQRNLLSALCAELQVAPEHVHCVKLRWNFEDKCQYDDATIYFSCRDAARRVCQEGSFRWQDTVLPLKGDRQLWSGAGSGATEGRCPSAAPAAQQLAAGQQQQHTQKLYDKHG